VFSLDDCADAQSESHVPKIKIEQNRIGSTQAEQRHVENVEAIELTGIFAQKLNANIRLSEQII
jgi:hypothetical protein